MTGAKGVLVLITAAKGALKLAESREAMNTIRAFASPEAHVIYGTAYDESLGDQIRVTVVATGLAHAGKRIAPPLTVIQRTGTDNVGYAPQAIMPSNSCLAQLQVPLIKEPSYRQRLCVETKVLQGRVA
jgi:cell division protein FtsZ